MGEVDAFAPVAGGPGQFRSVQSAEEAGDLVLGPPSREWDETLGAGKPESRGERGDGTPSAPHGTPEEDVLYVPAALNCHLREYQRDGVRFLYALWASKRGGVLADDMGLGKTVQSVALLAHLKEHNVAGSPLNPSLNTTVPYPLP